VLEEGYNGIIDFQISQAQLPEYSPWYMALISQGGSKEFLSHNLIGNEVVLSGDFMVLSDGREIQLNETTFRVPAQSISYQLPSYRFSRSRTATVVVPEASVPVPGIELLNSQFGFMLQQNEEDNYTAAVKILNATDVSQIVQNVNESRGVFINASEVTVKDSWYKATARVSEDFVLVEVCNDNGTCLDSARQSMSGQSLGKFGVLMTFQTGQIVAFKNLKVEATMHVETSTYNVVPEAQEIVLGNGFEFLYPYVRISLLLAGMVLLVVSFWQKRKNLR
jgi:hypothetical protein